MDYLDEEWERTRGLIPRNIPLGRAVGSKKETFVVLWPDEKVSVVQAPDLHFLYDWMEKTCDLDKCHIQRVDDFFHLWLTFEPTDKLKKHGDTPSSDECGCGDFPDTQSEVMSQYEELFFTGDMSDVTVYAGSKEIKCHRLILSTQCPYFAAMFRSECSEAKKGEVHIEAFQPEVVHTVIRYLYSGKVIVCMLMCEDYYSKYGDPNEVSWYEAKIDMHHPFPGKTCGHCSQHEQCSCLQYDIDPEFICNDSEDSSEETKESGKEAEMKPDDGVVEDTNQEEVGDANQEEDDPNNPGDNMPPGELENEEQEEDDPNLGDDMENEEQEEYDYYDDESPSDECPKFKETIDSIRMNRLFWKDFYLAGDYFSLPNLQKIALLRLRSLCCQLKKFLMDPTVSSCKEIHAIVKVLVLFYELGGEVEGLSILQSLTCQMIREYMLLDAKQPTINFAYTQKAEFLCKFLPQEIKDRVLTVGDPRIFSSLRHVKWLVAILSLVDRDGGIPSEKIGNNRLLNFEQMLKEDKASAECLNDINGLHLVAHLCGADAARQCISELTKDESTFYYAKIFSCLIQNGADVNKTDAHGNTPMHVAAEYLRWQLVSVLLQHDADSSAGNKEGKNPLGVAWQSFDRHGGIFANAGSMRSQGRYRELVLYRTHGYQKITQFLVLKGDSSVLPPPGNESAQPEPVSSELIEKLMSGSYEPHFKLVQNGRLPAKEFYDTLWQAAYPNLARRQNIGFNTMRNVYSMRGEDPEESLKQLLTEEGERDAAKVNFPKFVSLQSRLAMKCGRLHEHDTCDMKDAPPNCLNCTNILEGIEEVIPKEVLQIHSRLARFCED